jgi:hypothetical protein
LLQTSFQAFRSLGETPLQRFHSIIIAVVVIAQVSYLSLHRNIDVPRTTLPGHCNGDGNLTPWSNTCGYRDVDLIKAGVPRR